MSQGEKFLMSDFSRQHFAGVHLRGSTVWSVVATAEENTNKLTEQTAISTSSIADFFTGMSVVFWD